MHSRKLDSGNSIYKAAFESLLKIMDEAEKRFDVKLYIDSHIGNGKTWMDSCVYIHGDRNVVNIVCMKLIVWQHRQGITDGLLYAYPVETLYD